MAMDWLGARAHNNVWPRGTRRLASRLRHQGKVLLYDFCEEIVIFNPPFRCAQLTAVTEGKVKGTQEYFDKD